MDTNLRSQIEAWFAAHTEEYVADLAKIVNIRSVSDPTSPVAPFGQGCRDVLDKMLEIGTDYGFQAKNYDYYVGSLTAPGKGEGTVGLWGHLDVVPEGDGWEHQPYNMTREGDVLFGRGVSDNKGPALVGLYALRCLRDLGIELRNTVSLYLGTDEEKGMSDVTWFREHYPLPDCSIIPDSGFPVCYGEKGILEGSLVSAKALSGDILEMSGGLVSNMVPDKAYVVLKESAALFQKLNAISAPFTVEREPGKVIIRAEGQAVHAAFPYNGVNAIHLLTQMLVASGIATPADAEILNFATAVNNDVLGTALNIACEDEVSGNLTCVGSLLSMKDGKLCLGFNVRYPVTADGDAIRASIINTASENGYTLEKVRDSKPAYVPKDSPLVTTLNGIFNQITGEEREPYTMAGGTYARKLTNAVAFGPGGLETPDNLPEMGGAHQHDEGVYLPSLLQAALIYTMTLVALDGVKLK